MGADGRLVPVASALPRSGELNKMAERWGFDLVHRERAGFLRRFGAAWVKLYALVLLRRPEIPVRRVRHPDVTVPDAFEGAWGRLTAGSRNRAKHGQFNLLVDGRQWWNDPEAPKVPNLWGSENEYVDVP